MGLFSMHLLAATAPMSCLRRRATGGFARRHILLQAVLLLVGKQGSCKLLKVPSAHAAAQAHACCLQSDTMLMKLLGESCHSSQGCQHCCWLSQCPGPSPVCLCAAGLQALYIAEALCECAGIMGKPADENEELGGTTRLQQTKLAELGMVLCFSHLVHLRALHCEPWSGQNQI